jgi:hypothetical protein
MFCNGMFHEILHHTIFELQEISAAFSVLSNVKTRQQYDMGLLDLLDVEE